PRHPHRHPLRPGPAPPLGPPAPPPPRPPPGPPPRRPPPPPPPTPPAPPHPPPPPGRPPPPAPPPAPARAGPSPPPPAPPHHPRRRPGRPRPTARPPAPRRGDHSVTAPSPTRPLGVVIATRNRSGRLAVTLRHLLALPERPEILVADNASTDDTRAVLARDFPEVRVLALPVNHGALARNHGARALGTPYVAFSDDDSWWAPGALGRAAELFDAHPRLGLIAARTLVGPDERP